MLRSIAIAITSILLITGCSQGDGTDDFEVNNSTLKISQVGDHLEATFTGGEFDIAATADLIGPDMYALQINVANGTIDATLDAVNLQTEISGIAEGGVEFIVTQPVADSLKLFAAAMFQNLPVKAGLGDKLFRVASLYGAHPVGEVVETRLVVSDKTLHGWSSLCGSMGASYTARFDYEHIHCSWSGCHYEHNGSWTSTVGGYNGSNGCFAGCGVGCDTSSYTTDCGNHDGCLNAGYSGYQCSDEFAYASDDFLFAPDC